MQGTVKATVETSVEESVEGSVEGSVEVSVYVTVKQTVGWSRLVEATPQAHPRRSGTTKKPRAKGVRGNEVVLEGYGP